MLRKGMEYGDADIIENIFRTCATLHNMLLIYDNYDNIMNDEETWENLDPTETGVVHEPTIPTPTTNEVIVHRSYDLSLQWSAAIPVL